MADLLKRQVLPEHPTLILWAVGAVAAVNGADSRQLASDIAQSLAILKANNIDVILIDMQYSPIAVQMIDFRPYLEALQVSAENSDIPLFGRFAAMRQWSEDGMFDLDGMDPDKRDHMTMEVDACVGVGLAQLIVRAAALHPAEEKSR
jgi:hypothetical protein